MAIRLITTTNAIVHKIQNAFPHSDCWEWIHSLPLGRIFNANCRRKSKTVFITLIKLLGIIFTCSTVCFLDWAGLKMHPCCVSFKDQNHGLCLIFQQTQLKAKRHSRRTDLTLARFRFEPKPICTAKFCYSSRVACNCQWRSWIFKYTCFTPFSEAFNPNSGDESLLRETRHLDLSQEYFAILRQIKQETIRTERNKLLRGTCVVCLHASHEKLA